MTLNVTALTEHTIYQSADFRLTNLDTKQVQSDTSTKLVVLQYAAGDGFVSYTGIGRWRGRDTSEYVVEWLIGTAGATPSQIAQSLCDKGTEWLNSIKTVLGPQRHTFILAAFQRGIAQLWVISNFEDCYGRNDPNPARSLAISTWQYERQPRVVVTGWKPAVQRPQRRRIERLLQRTATDPAQIRRALAEVNEEAANSSTAQQMISKACSVVSFRADGQGFGDIQGAVDVHTIAEGVAQPSARETARLLGIRNPQLVGMTFGSAKSRVAYAPCRPTVVTPPGSGYVIREATHSAVSSCRAVDVSDAGVVLGDGRSRNSPAQSVLWTSPVSGAPRLCGFAATASRVNGRGQVAAKALLNDGSARAIRWDSAVSGAPEDLGCFRGRDSGARAINEAALVAGWVCIHSENRGQANFRPAVWPTASASIRVLEDLGGEGGEAVDVNDAGLVLVVTHPPSPADPVRCLVWDLSTDVIELVGREARGVSPTAITGQGIVLGTFRNASGESVAAVGKSGEGWSPLGTPPGFYATAMNNRGDVVGTMVRDRYEQPWLRLASGDMRPLPYFEHHWCRPLAISDTGVVVGTAQSDHGMHGLVWVAD